MYNLCIDQFYFCILQLFDFAKYFPGNYQNSIPVASKFYASSGYEVKLMHFTLLISIYVTIFVTIIETKSCVCLVDDIKQLNYETNCNYFCLH